MRASITLEQPGTPGTLGQASWTTYAIARAEIRTLTGKEAAEPHFIGSQTTHACFTRYTPSLAGVNARMRIRLAEDGNRIFHITHVIRDVEGNTRELQLYCREVMTNG